MILLSRSNLSIENGSNGDISQQENWEIIKETIVSFYGEVVFRSWFRSVNFSCYHSGVICLTVSSRFIRDWIKTKYLDFILKAWREIDKRIINIDLVVGDTRKNLKDLNNVNKNVNYTDNSQRNTIINNDIDHSDAFYNVIIDTKNGNFDSSDKALSVRKNYGFEDIVENFQDLAGDFENQKLKKAKNPQKKMEKINLFQQNLSLIDEEDDISNMPVKHLIQSSPIFQQQIVEKNLYFDERFTFDNFVKDDCNELAFFTAKAFAENKKIANFSCNQNPLFLYGGVGLGKTHLIHAIANHKIQDLRMQFPNDWEKKAREKIIYSSSERFMREFLSALRSRDTKSFKDKFKNVDILMIDDIQFLNGKGCTQEEFFHIFINLMMSGKQLVISADRVPSALVGIGERLKSRLGCGIVADIQKGDYNFRLNVLKKKAYYMNNDFQTHVLEFLARNIHSSIRELEGALNKLIMMRNLNSNRIIDIAFVQEKLADMISTKSSNSNNSNHELQKKHYTHDHIDENQRHTSRSEVSTTDITNGKNCFIYKIQLKIANYYNISIDDLLSNSRIKKIVLPKQIAMFLARKMTHESFSEIAKKFGGKDHTTIIYSCNKIKELMSKDVNISEEINKLMISLRE